jgi:hypothetical protein
VYATVTNLQHRDRELAGRVARLEAQLDDLTAAVHAAAAEARGEAARISEEVRWSTQSSQLLTRRPS